MKNKKRIFFNYFVLFVTLSACVYFALNSFQQKRILAAQAEKLDALESNQEQLTNLSALDQFTIAGNYEEALKEYTDFNQKFPSEAIELRISLLKNLISEKNNYLSLQENLMQNDTIADSTEVLNPTLDKKLSQIDSLEFALNKTKAALKRTKKQLQQKAAGEYLTFTNRNGSQVNYVGHVKNGVANGYGVAILNTGSRYVGEWKNNQRHGDGTYYWSDGAHYEGQYANDKRSGKGTYYWPNGEKYVGYWKDDVRTGEGVFYGEKGKVIASGVWKNDELVAVAKNHGM